MSGCVQYEQNSEMMVELYGEERKIIDFMPILEKYFTCKNCGYTSNDDRIGAMNLYRMGINYLADSQVPDTVVTE